MSYSYNHAYIARARKLRKEMTRQEKHLWYDFLNKTTVRFQRQKIIGNYIVDFYCHSKKLVIEIDGSQHYEDSAREYDSIRTEFLNSLGLKVLRYSNDDIDRNFTAVCENILEIL